MSVGGENKVLAVLKEPPPALPGENALNYRLFVEWWRSGGEIDQQGLAEMVGCSRATVARGKRRWRWDERMSAAIAEAAVGSPADAAVWAKRKEEVRQREWELHKEAVELAIEAMRRWRESEETPSLSEIAKMLELASRLGRLAAGLGPEVGSGDGGGPSPLRLEFQAALLKVWGPKREEPSARVVDVEAECAPRTVDQLVDS